MVVKNTTAYTWEWYCHLMGDRASFYNCKKLEKMVKFVSPEFSLLHLVY
jgi:hypothetical protein